MKTRLIEVSAFTVIIFLHGFLMTKILHLWLWTMRFWLISKLVLQTNYGDIEFGFYPSVAPKTVEHIFKLVRLGCYNTNHFFRVVFGN